MGNKTLNKKVYIICGSFLGIFLMFLVGIAINKLNYEKKLLTEGIRAQAQVINKYHLKTNTGKIKKSYIELAVFEDTTAIAKQKRKEIREESKNINDKIDNLFDNLGTKNIPIGDYTSITVLTGLEYFGTTKIGEFKTFVYLKDEAINGILLDALE